MSGSRRRDPNPSIRWSDEDLEEERRVAIDRFRVQRMAEPLDAYLKQFDEMQGVLEELIATTADLTQLEEHALNILTDRRLLDGFRYLAGPPISVDDLRVLVDSSLSRAALQQEPEAIRRAIEMIMVGLDRRRFAWVRDGRGPSQEERTAAIVATAAMYAMR